MRSIGYPLPWGRTSEGDRLLLFFVLVFRTVCAQRSAKLHLSKSKAVAQLVRGARQFLQPFAPPRFEKIELLSTMCEAAKAHAEQADFSFHVAMLGKQHLKNAKDIGIQPRWLRKSFRPRVGVKPGVANGQG